MHQTWFLTQNPHIKTSLVIYWILTFWIEYFEFGYFEFWYFESLPGQEPRERGSKRKCAECIVCLYAAPALASSQKPDLIEKKRQGLRKLNGHNGTLSKNC